MLNQRKLCLGGFDGSMPLNTAEYIDPRSRKTPDPKRGKWIKIAPMNQARFGVGCCVMDGTNLRTVERYDPDLDTWKMLAPMETAR